MRANRIPWGKDSAKEGNDEEGGSPDPFCGNAAELVGGRSRQGHHAHLELGLTFCFDFRLGSV
jgi:hypothetical protein